MSHKITDNRFNKYGIIKKGVLTKYGYVKSHKQGLYIVYTDINGSTYQFEHAQLVPLPRRKRGAFIFTANRKKYYEDFTILGKPIEVNRVMWTPVIFDDEKDPCFFKTKMIVSLKECKGLKRHNE